MKFLFLFILILSACSSPKKMEQAVVNDEDYLVALEYIKNNKLIMAAPLLDKSCKKGMLAACLAGGTPVDRAMMKGAWVYQGATDTKTTQMNAIVPRGSQYYPVIWEGLKLLPDNAYSFELQSREHSDWAVMKLAVGNLKPGHTYRIDILDEKSRLIDFRYFSSHTDSQKSLKFLVASCMMDEYQDLQSKIWPEAVATSPDAVFLIGDNTYGDWVDGKPIKEGVGEKLLWRRMVEMRQRIDYFKIETLIPTYAVWDDHDYGKNNGDKYFTHKIDNQLVFKTFWSQERNNLLIPGRGVGFYLKLRSHNFYFLDNRSFRDPANDGLGGHFGDDQEKWLFNMLKRNRSHNWLISGDQFFGGHHPFESYEGLHPNKFKEFINNLKRSKAKTFFISGDRHLTELLSVEKSDVGSKTYEVTSSGIHAKYFAGTLKKYTSKRMVAGAGGQSNYVVIDSLASPNEWTMNLKALSVGKKVLYEQDLMVE
jgi:alkaline phosphatase D